MKREDFNAAFSDSDYAAYRVARDNGDSQAAINAYFGVHRVPELEKRYRESTPFMSAITDPMKRDWREPADVTCGQCGVKFCFGRCQRFA